MKICFLSLNSYPLLTGKNLGYAGGAEVEQVCLAKELVAQGHDVCFVTYYHGRNSVESVNSIKVIKTYERDKACEMSVFLKFGSIWSALEKANTDIYFHEAGSRGVLPLFCYVKRKKFVYRIPSDAVVLGTPIFGDYSSIEKFAEVFEVKRANVIVAQSEFQRTMLKERFGVESVVIKNGMTIPKVNFEKHDPPTVLWVASISSVKRPHLFVELAKAIPYARFQMVGGKTKGEPQLHDKITDMAQEVPNLKFHGFVPYHQVNEYFRNASIFINTSSIEGFPYTFLQAWAHYTPVVSLRVDPDMIIRNEKVGFWSGTFKQLTSDVNNLLGNEKLRKKMGENARNYVEREHDIREAVKKYLEIFEVIL